MTSDRRMQRSSVRHIALQHLLTAEAERKGLSGLALSTPDGFAIAGADEDVELLAAVGAMFATLGRDVARAKIADVHSETLDLPWGSVVISSRGEHGSLQQLAPHVQRILS